MNASFVKGVCVTVIVVAVLYAYTFGVHVPGWLAGRNHAPEGAVISTQPSASGILERSPAAGKILLPQVTGGIKLPSLAGVSPIAPAQPSASVSLPTQPSSALIAPSRPSPARPMFPLFAAEGGDTLFGDVYTDGSRLTHRDGTGWNLPELGKKIDHFFEYGADVGDTIVLPAAPLTQPSEPGQANRWCPAAAKAGSRAFADVYSDGCRLYHASGTPWDLTDLGTKIELDLAKLGGRASAVFTGVKAEFGN